MNALEVDMGDGIRAQLDSYVQYSTYGGLLDEHPDEKLNEQITQGVIERAREQKEWQIERTVFLRNRVLVAPPVHLLNPLVKYKPDRVATDEMPVARNIGYMPNRACIGNFTTFMYRRKKESTGSFLIVVWFQDEMNKLLADEVVRDFRSVPWKKLAEDFDIC